MLDVVDILTKEFCDMYLISGAAYILPLLHIHQGTALKGHEELHTKNDMETEFTF